MGELRSTGYSGHMQCLQGYIEKVQDCVKKGADLQDIGATTGMNGPEYVSYLQSIERKHRQLQKASDLCDAVSLLSEVSFGHAELDMSIRHAEYLLHVTFSPEYRNLLYQMGGITYRYGSLSGAIPVMQRTLLFRKRHLFSANGGGYYVVDAAEDGYLFVQDVSGNVFEVLPEGSIEYYCSSLLNLVKMREFGLGTERALYV